ncbi:MAG: hypothetical protein ACHQO8_00310 [Vicinamibacterales bacterium]
MQHKSIGIAVAAACAAALMGSPVAAAAASASKGVVTMADPASGARIRLQQDKPGEVAIEVSDRQVTVRRQLTPGRLQTDVTTASEKISFVLDPGGLAISTSRGKLRMSLTDPDAGRAAAQLLGSSVALRRASALLGRVKLGDSSPVTHTLLLTRAFLLAMAGQRDEAMAVVQQARATLQAVRIVRTRFGGGPDDCWNEYAREAIAAYKELEDCMKNVAWYDIFGGAACTSIYDLRAIGAFSWYLSCVGLSGARS